MQSILVSHHQKKKLVNNLLKGLWGRPHIIRNALGGGGQRFVTKPCENIGICRVLRYEGEGGQKSWKIALRNIWTTPYKSHCKRTIIRKFQAKFCKKNQQAIIKMKKLLGFEPRTLRTSI
jgi:hypothetical protein